MPEGDTIHRTALSLRRVLVGHALVRYAGRKAPDEAMGSTIASVEARGKHLLVTLETGACLHTHMRMTGSWHVYAPGARWRKPRRQARAVLGVAEHEAVCFNAPVLEWLTPLQLAHHPQLTRLGPDLLAPDPDLHEAAARLRALGELPIGQALLRQDCVAGIGNVYKSELLFRARIDPRTPVPSVPDDALDALLEDGRRVMRANLSGRPRNTRGALTGPRYFVYDRAGEVCLVCGGPIARTYQGENRRSTYWCPACQAQPSRASTA